MNKLQQFQSLQQGHKYKRWDYVIKLSKFLKINPKNITEIGVWEGEFFLPIRETFPNAQINLIDPYKVTADYIESGKPPKSYENKVKAVRDKITSIANNQSNTTLYEMTSTEAANKIQEKQDIVFIDGDHSYENVKSDIKIWKPKIRKGGILCGHDFKYIKEVRKAVEELLPDHVISGINKGDVWAVLI